MKANPSVCESVKSIKERISHADLLSHYFGIDSLPVLIKSPLRADEHPSFYIFSPDGNKVLFRDYASGEKGDIYTLLQRQKGMSFSQVMHSIASEGAFLNSTNSLSTSSGRRKCSRSNVDIKVKVREWKDYDIDYWKAYGISLQWLQYADVYPISHKIIYKDGQRYVFHAAKLAYVFVERKEGNVSLKVYQPEVKDKRFKWTTSNDASVVGLWTKIPQQGDSLVICSSLKDALCLWANTGIPAIYVQSETTKMSQTAQEVLRQRYKNIFVCFDNDLPGLQDGLNFSLQTGFTNIVLPDFPEGKDISDLYRFYGKEKFISIVKPLFNTENGKQESQEC